MKFSKVFWFSYLFSSSIVNANELVGESYIPLFGEPSSFTTTLGIELAKENALEPVTKKYTLNEDSDVTYAHRPEVLSSNVELQKVEACEQSLCLKTKVVLHVKADVSKDFNSRLQKVNTLSLSDIVDDQLLALDAVKQKYRINAISTNANQALLHHWLSFAAEEELELLKRAESKKHFDGFDTNTSVMEVYRIKSDLVIGSNRSTKYTAYRVTNPAYQPPYVNSRMAVRYKEHKNVLRFNHHYSKTKFTNPFNSEETIIWRGRYDCLGYRNARALLTNQSAVNITMLNTQPELDVQVNGKRLTVGRGYFDYEGSLNAKEDIIGIKGASYPSVFCEFIHGEMIFQSTGDLSSYVDTNVPLNYRVKLYDLPPTFRARNETLPYWVPVRDAYNNSYYTAKFEREASDYLQRCSDDDCYKLYLNQGIKEKIYNSDPMIKLPIEGKLGQYPMRLESYAPINALEINASRPWFIEDCEGADCGFTKDGKND